MTRTKFRGSDLACAESFIPLIAAVVSAAGSVGGTVIAGNNATKLEKASAADAAKAAAAAEAANKPATPTIGNSPQAVAAMEGDINNLQAEGSGGLSPSFYTEALNSAFPGYQDITSQVVQNSLTGK